MTVADASSPVVLCLVEGCQERKRSRGRCSRHYRQWLYSPEGQAAKQKYNTPVEFKVPKSEIERAYLAGLIDGDGCITLRDPVNGYWAIKISMTDKEIIDWLFANVGGTVTSFLHKNRKRRMYLWQLSAHADVRQFLIAVAPHLKVHAKQGKAQAALAGIEAKTRKKAGNCDTTVRLF